MSTIYKGTGWSKTAVGEYDDGTIYSGTDWNKKPIGEYDNDTIYEGTDWGKRAIGSFDDGMIYKGTGWDKSAIGEYQDGTVYRGTGWDRTEVGEYDGFAAGAAAFLLLSFDSARGGSDKRDILWYIFYAIGTVLRLILQVLRFIFHRIIVNAFMVLYAGPTFYLSLGTFMLMFIFPPLGFVTLGLAIVVLILSIPYWKRVYALKKKADLSKYEFGRLWAMWGIKGRLAYAELEAAEKRFSDK